MTTTMTISPTGRAALAQLWANERRNVATHRSAVHASAREALLARGLICYVEAEAMRSGLACVVVDEYLGLTDEGRRTAEALA